MASDKKFADFVVDQISNAGEITAKKMFGEFGLYAGGKLFGLICDNRLFIKPTKSGKAFAGEVREKPPYPGAKPGFLIEEKIDDRGWLSELVRITVNELPAPKPRRRK
jgi:TfoX/Sxy family transcriptional regulator of competence genes